ncbi:hypothetical protein LSH36_14g00031 [Paralvinella palmiformis]|uniref:Uncharacterized protein n=1 Tax=Paralvinella palmiformis TaxID=53620 RepID=A0AAD9NHS0_9ANNE|nr:hypothetical protein LSH36_14g00031 [Paralvinella palmiformis]
MLQLQDDNLSLEEQVKELESVIGLTKSDGRAYSPEIRRKVFDAIVAQVPKKHISSLIESFSSLRSWITVTDIPHRSTVEAMVRELREIGDRQTAEAILDNWDCTLGFDATTQEGIHLNSIHITTQGDCYVIAADKLAGGGSQQQVWGSDCCASKILVQMNKLHFKDGKCDPQGFKIFHDDHKLPHGLIPWYRERLRLETKSARSHNMDAEEVIGMFSAAKQKATNATTCFLSCKTRAQNNRTVDYLNGLEKDKRDKIIIQAIQIGGKQRTKRRMKQKDLEIEALRRQAEKGRQETQKKTKNY